MRRKKIIIIRSCLWLALAIVLACLVYLKIVPAGKISYVNDFSKPNFFIGKLTPAERVATIQGEAQVKGDPVYFSLRPPRRFETAEVTIKFKNTTDYPIMELGLLNDKIAWSYDLKPLQNKIIDQLALVWPVVSGPGNVRLIEREKKYDSVEKFLANLPDKNQIALYNYNLKNKFLLDNYSAREERQTIDCGFRGSYQFYTYIKNENLAYTFNFSDLNSNKDNDPVDIKVYSQDGLIYTTHVADDAAASPERQASLALNNLPEGVYRISFIANDDIITKAIVSQQSRLALINRVWLADGVSEKNFILYTNSRSVSAQTINPASLGEIKIGEGELDLNQTYRQFSLTIPDITVSPGPKSGSRDTRPAGATRIELPKDDVIISGDGVFGFKPEELVDPSLKKVDKNIDINRENINYILANYASPISAGDWQTVSAEFDLTRAYQENGKYQFLISIPGLKAEEANAGAVIVKEIKVDLSGVSLKEKIDKYLSK